MSLKKRKFTYKKTVSDEYANKLKLWQDNVYKEFKTRKTQQINFLGRTFTIPPKVHPINPMSDLLGNAVLKEVKETDKVLDMGTGSGVNAILAASKSKDVLGVDINPNSIECARLNAQTNNVADRIIFQQSDGFKAVDGKFDLIVIDPPFRWFAPRDIYEVGTTDENYNFLNGFFSDVRNYLLDDGRILLCFGSSGDIDYLNKLIDVSGFKKEIIAKRDLLKEGINVSYYTYRLTRK